MKFIDFTMPADLFWSVSAKRIAPKGTLRFRSVPSLAEAVRFFIEDRSEARYHCAIETDEGRFSADEIELLYDGSDFPAASWSNDNP